MAFKHINREFFSSQEGLIEVTGSHSDLIWKKSNLSLCGEWIALSYWLKIIQNDKINVAIPFRLLLNENLVQACYFLNVSNI